MTSIQQYSKLVHIHKRVLKGFKYVTDQKQFQVRERWVMPEDPERVTGDCEDFALACRKLCREQNIASRLVVCNDETGEGHCVLEVNGWILDNRQKSVIARDDLDYKWLAISGFESGEKWKKL